MPQPLQGLLVIEVETSLGGAFAGKQLAELGARVVKIEPPGGGITRHTGPYRGDRPDPELAAPHLFLDTAKESAVLDLGDSGAGAALRDLLSRADVVLHSAPPERATALGLLPEEACRRWPSLIVGALTPFGIDGPWADLPATELTIAALGGYMNVVGDPGRQPLAPFGHQVEHSGGQVLTIGVLAALAARERDGHGDYVDISLLEVNNSTLDAPLIGGYWYLGRNQERKGNLTGAFDALRCKDGFVYVAPITEQTWEAMIIACGRDEMADDPRLANWDLRRENWQVVREYVQSWCAELTGEEVLARLQELRVPSAIALSMEQLLSDPQVAARGLLKELDHPRAGRLLYPAAPVLSDALEYRVERAPLLGEHQGAIEQIEALPARAAPSRPPAVPRRLPLEGIRIADLTQVWAAPFCTVMLAELGADVIHIESPTRPDMTRFWTVNLDLEGPLWEKSGYFAQHNRAKRSLILNLAFESGRETFKELVTKSDILINNFSARVMENWGFTYEEMRKVNPRLIYLTMPSYGATGPYRDHVSFGDSLQAACGFVRWRGYDAESPRRSGPMPDPYAAFAAATLLLAGLRLREQTGRGVYFDLGQRDACVRLIGDELIAFQLNHVEPQQFENAHREWVPHRAYRCAGEDRWVTIAARTDGEWQAVCRAMHRRDLAEDRGLAIAPGRKERRAEVDAAIEAWTVAHEAKWVETTMLRAGVSAGAVQRAGEILEHPQFLHRDFFPWVEHPVGGPARLHTTPVYLRGLPHARTNRRAPLFGEHTGAILSGLLGLSDERIAALEAEGAAGGEPNLEGVVLFTG